MKITLDSNVIIAGFIAHGTCEVVMEKWFQQHFEVILSEYIIDEVKKSLNKKIKIPLAKVKEIERLLRTNSTLVAPMNIIEKKLRDPKDLPIIGTAVAGDSKLLVTGDQDLLVLKKYKKIKIVNPREFLNQLRIT